MNAATGTDPPRIVSIQSQSVYGCAGNAAAVPLLHALGATVFAVPTVLLSNTPHYPTIAARDVPAAFFGALLDRLLERAPPATLDAVLVGYVRRPEVVVRIARFVDRVRRGRPDVAILIDPVMGDVDLGAYVPEGARRAVHDELVPRADICTPNVFEAHLLCGLGPPGIRAGGADSQALLTTLRGLGPSTVVLTGIGLGGGTGRVTTALSHGGERWEVTTPVIDARPTGTGDVLAAAFLHHMLAGHPVPEALRRAVDLTVGVMADAVAAGRDELEPSRLPAPAAPAELLRWR